MELAKLDVFVSIETLRSYAGQLDFESYRAARKPTLTARHHKSRLQWAKEHFNRTEDQWRNVAWSDESRFCVEDSRRLSTAKGCGSGAMIKKHTSIFWSTGSILGLKLS
ncbi:hypothetical protein G6F43_008164 [Rhizopus delemar]|nr:hypothetical protein G6F43_008164 [Rhizopus delemar]